MEDNIEHRSFWEEPIKWVKVETISSGLPYEYTTINNIVFISCKIKSVN